MFAITGITGKVGGETARTLLAAGKQVRAIMRDVRKGQVWSDTGCEVVAADINDVCRRGRCFHPAAPGL